MAYGNHYLDSKLRENINDLVDRVKKNKASLLIIDGGIGEGKTTLGVQIGDYINELFKFPETDIKKNEQLAMGGEDFLKKLRICYNKKYPVLVYDEAGDFNRRGSLTRFNAMVNRTFETFRAFRIIVILCLPSFHVLDSDLFDKQIPRLLLHLRDRTENQGKYTGYSLYRMRYIKRKMEKLIVPNFAFNMVEPNFYGQFRDLSKKRSQQLDIVSTAGKMKTLIKAEIQVKGLYSYNQLAQKLGRSIVWVRNIIQQLKLKHTDIIQQAKYFDENVLNRLVEYRDSRE